MNFLVTGSSGFIGSHLIDRLVSNGHSVISCDFLNSDVHPDALFDRDYLIKLLDGVDAVFHLGAISSTVEPDVSELSKWNLGSSCILLECCLESSTRLIYASSASVYGDGKNGFSEHAQKTPNNYYAVSKSAFDDFVVLKLRDDPYAEIVGLRYFNVYGSNEASKGPMASPVHKFLTHAKETGKIDIFEGSKKYFRDFVHIKDAVEMTVYALMSESGIYNVGTGSAVSFYDIAEKISDLTDADIKYIPFPTDLIGKYQKYTCADLTLTLSTGFPKPQYDMHTGILEVHEKEG